MIPGAKDIPTDFRIYIQKNNENKLGILGSKGKWLIWEEGSILGQSYSINRIIKILRLKLKKSVSYNTGK